MHLFSALYPGKFYIGKLKENWRCRDVSLEENSLAELSLSACSSAPGMWVECPVVVDRSSPPPGYAGMVIWLLEAQRTRRLEIFNTVLDKFWHQPILLSFLPDGQCRWKYFHGSGARCFRSSESEHKPATTVQLLYSRFIWQGWLWKSLTAILQILFLSSKGLYQHSSLRTEIAWSNRSSPNHRNTRMFTT